MDWYNPSMLGRERIYRTEGVVLRRQDLGEADRLTTIYTRDYGKLRLVAKGVRKPRSRKAGHLEPFTRVSLLIARGRELDIITQAETIEDYSVLRNNLDDVGHASYIVELVDRFSVEEGEGNHAQYQLILKSFDRLTEDEYPPSSVILYFQMRLLDFVGYRPELFRCVGCGSEIRPEGQFFSSQQGGILCPNCGRGKQNNRSISLAGLKVLRHYQRNNFETASKPKVSRELFQEVEHLMEGYINYLIERQLNVPSFMRRIENLHQSE
jgi:DNA repair protein RecO (recombination protein O)